MDLDDLDGLDLVAIDPLPSRVWHRDMADFAEAISDAVAGQRLARAIQGRGAFRRFKTSSTRSTHTSYPHGTPSTTHARGAGPSPG
ncbi:hypothetical protein O7635_01025 [Asanoa sp. WMMD1127]|uniref:hypothetical protein n=1 Tax=Asanoa sp. WMMD1127 TaxID=3016107 RepID=UPI002415F330|nr:hypothetical protein [Asanoa sp. WMMD1127]MDG4820434.1 hypothetical protein [Asanoa sp. WMMD1127]